mmetsp:Transcript_5317/g.5474  ORF Transcript_5317/g.5474 Transcript_5317/m.5474 type:complete len:408 (-) Transcript_5317:127-1350(-)|eukprot:CAMPEP_0182430390 /NCGR_PEP_ID=MMETSP1167-20130531/40124_1 /TAXON_ID=2988 /ORGANISM="Mallomonas Sp, Strain CCMP3275" /LENGTH=407 /DNA_ID=CAMNT_0024615429 /DNA_START=187 /DNA_END=1410 /DNA_ORIENTATION=+
MAFQVLDSTMSIVGAGIAAHSYVRDKEFHERQMAVSKQLHEEEINVEKRHHKEEYDLTVEQHSIEMDLAKETHIREMNTALESHFQQLNTDLMNATREAERDMYDQRNAEFQTLILCSTVMFTALSTVIIQGQLPTDGIGDGFYIFMAIVSGFSFALLFLCIVLCTKIVLRSTLFMYRRANKQTKRVYGLIEKTIQLMKKVREFGKNKNLKTIDKKIQNMHDRVIESFFRSQAKNMGRTMSFGDSAEHQNSSHRRNTSGYSNDDQPARSKSYSGYNESGGIELGREWDGRERDGSGTAAASGMTDDNPAYFSRADADKDTRPGTFEHFWLHHCERQGRVATWLFYAGTAFMLISVAVYMYAWFTYTYKSPTGALLAVIFLGISLVIGLSVAYFMDDEPDYKEVKKRN